MTAIANTLRNYFGALLVMLGTFGGLSILAVCIFLMFTEGVLGFFGGAIGAYLAVKGGVQMIGVGMRLDRS